MLGFHFCRRIKLDDTSTYAINMQVCMYIKRVLFHARRILSQRIGFNLIWNLALLYRQQRCIYRAAQAYTSIHLLWRITVTYKLHTSGIYTLHELNRIATIISQLHATVDPHLNELGAKSNMTCLGDRILVSFYLSKEKDNKTQPLWWFLTRMLYSELYYVK